MRKRTRPSRVARCRALFLESLEPRRLLAAGSWTVEDGVLLVEGTPASDQIVLSSRSGGKVALRLNGLRSGPLAVEQIVVHAGAGNDTVRVEGNVSIPLEAHGGDGRDLLIGGRGADLLRGDADGDQLHGNGGGDTLVGGADRDLLFGDVGQDVLHGGAGADQLFGGKGDDLVVGGRDDDRLLGHAGGDLLIGGLGSDWIEGHDGNDLIVGGPTVYDADDAALRLLRTATLSIANTADVLTLQGDRLDPATATDPANYRVTWLGPDGEQGGGDDQLIALSSNAQSVVYSPGSNIDIASGRTYRTAVRQTVTLLFDAPLPVGSYLVELDDAIQTADFNADEDGMLAGSGFAGHPVVQQSPSGPVSGASIEVRDLVFAAASPDFSLWTQGTPYLSQLHDDLGAILDQILSDRGDDPTISTFLNDHIRQRVAPGLATGLGLLVIWLDPPGFDIVNPGGDGAVYDPVIDLVSGEIPIGFIDVIGNMEVIVIVTPDGGEYSLVLSEVGPLARGGYVFVDEATAISESFTEEMRTGETEFEIVVP